MPSLLAERARYECARPMRAVEGNLGHSPINICKERREESPGGSLCSRNARSRTPLVGRAQWKINQDPPSTKMEHC